MFFDSAKNAMTDDLVMSGTISSKTLQNFGTGRK